MKEASPTATSRDGHTGLRPLSPHGEGYCTVCRFVIGLTEKGLLERHWRGSVGGEGWNSQGWECKGSNRRPGRTTPVTSRLAAFRVKAKKTYCPTCGRGSLFEDRNGKLPAHREPYGSRADSSTSALPDWCEAGGWQAWDPRG